MITTNDIWIVNIKNELNKLGLAYLWDSDNLSSNVAYSIIENRFYDVCKQEMFADISNSSRGYIYQHLTGNFVMQYYLCKSINPIYKKNITRLRLSSHNLNIEQGRYRNENRNNRICTLCNSNDIEDEFHFVLKCPFYNDIRGLYVLKITTTGIQVYLSLYNYSVSTM